MDDLTDRQINELVVKQIDKLFQYLRATKKIDQKTFGATMGLSAATAAHLFGSRRMARISDIVRLVQEYSLSSLDYFIGSPSTPEEALSSKKEKKDQMAHLEEISRKVDRLLEFSDRPDIKELLHLAESSDTEAVQLAINLLKMTKNKP